MADSPNYKSEQYEGNELPCRRCGLYECSCSQYNYLHIECVLFLVCIYSFTKFLADITFTVHQISNAHSLRLEIS